MSFPLQSYIRRFQQNVSSISLPEKFTFPFYYQPHELVKLAAEELQRDLITRKLNHNFGLNDSDEGLIIGKMFGVLVVQDNHGKLGFLCAFSGKLADCNHHEGFVPPVFDMLQPKGYFKTGEAELTAINTKIELLESAEDYLKAKDFVTQQQTAAVADLERLKSEKKAGKLKRDTERKRANTLPEEEKKAILAELAKQSTEQSYTLKKAQLYWQYKTEEAKQKLSVFQQEIDTLKELRKQKSAALQNRLFSDYSFLNARKETANLLTIFKDQLEITPRAGAGECAAPKLLQFAYTHNLLPVAMGEFWWGASPKSEVRVHKQFYPACRSKCEPILGHMLEGLQVDESPLLTNPAAGKKFEIVYEDEHLLVVNKPAEFLSVPGKNVDDSVYTRIKHMYPKATGPLLVHRLDMSTSGLLLVAKNKDVHKKLQSQFLNKTISKRYEALLNNKINSKSGEIKLPLRVDLDNRPQQLVCYKYGKHAHTLWEKVSEKDGKTLVNLFPVTGRTHQLRVHCAHKDGLNTPIIGDDIYGTLANRLHLHAAYLKFYHPVKKEHIELYVPSEFGE